MDVYRVKRTEAVLSFGVSSASAGTGGGTGGRFRDSLGGSLREDYKQRAQCIFEEIKALSSELTVRIDMRLFQHFLEKIKDLLGEIVRNAYVLCPEDIMDFRGRRRILSCVEIVDQKLSDLAFDLLSSTSDRLDYLSRVDEIRGLIMDFLL